MSRLLLLLVALVVTATGLLLATTTTGAAAIAVRPAACAELACGHGLSATTSTEQHSSADPCGHHHPLCGGSGATSTDAGSLPLAALTALGLIACLRSLAGRPMWPARARLRSVLLVSGLERPPQPLV